MFPPLSHLEVVGNPHTEQHDGKPVVVLSIKVNINQKAQVIEEILGQRKQTIIGIADNVMKEVIFDLKLVSDAQCSQEKLQEELNVLKKRDAEWFNVDSNFKESLGILLSLKEETIFDFVSKHFTQEYANNFDLKDTLNDWFSLNPTKNAAPKNTSGKVDTQLMFSSKMIFFWIVLW